jgi:lipid-A-disaccharide synthase
MMSCGEPSGDLYAGALAEALKERDPSIEIVGFGGDQLAAAGGRLIGHFAGFSVTGLTEALRIVPKSLAMLRRLVRAARELRPDVFVAIDFPDFNFRLMSAIARLGIPVVYYISPQLWAWRSGRMRTMQRFVDRALVIFPFEQPLYQDAGVPVEFVGHPLVDMTHTHQPRAPLLESLGLDPGAPIVALLPGSRANELHRIAPTMADALPLIRARVPDVQFVVAAAPHLADELFAPFESPAGDAPGVGSSDDDRHPSGNAAAASRRPAIVRGRTDDVLAACDVVITASGTATVQCALHEKPMVVVYRLSSMTYRLGKPFVKVDTYAMANLVAGRRVVPELIQEEFTAARTAEEAVALLTDRERYERTRDALRVVRERLGAPGASGRAADAVLQVARAATRQATAANHHEP